MIIDSHVHISYLGEEKKYFSDVKKDLLASMKKYGIGYSIAIPNNMPNPQCAGMKTLAKIIKDEKQFFSMGTINIFEDLNRQIKELEILVVAKKIYAILKQGRSGLK